MEFRLFWLFFSFLGPESWRLGFLNQFINFWQNYQRTGEQSRKNYYEYRIISSVIKAYSDFLVRNAPKSEESLLVVLAVKDISDLLESRLHKERFRSSIS